MASQWVQHYTNKGEHFMLSKKLNSLLLLGSILLVNTASVYAGGQTIVDEAGSMKQERNSRRARKNRKENGMVATSAGQTPEWYDQGEIGGRKGRGSCGNSVCSKSSCGTCSEQRPPKAPYCKKMVEVSAPAELHRHLMYSYTCPEGFETA
jgi:hypothetical protein